MLKAVMAGRPNVGKSILFNRLAGRRLAIVEETSGVTRDRLYATVSHDGTAFQIIDTGGLVKDPDEMERHITRQTDTAVEEADLILFVVSAQDGRTPMDDMVAEKLRSLGKPVWLVVNKADNEKYAAAWADFCAYNYNPTITVSGLHAIGTDELLDRLLAEARRFEEAEAARAAEKSAAEDEAPACEAAGGKAAADAAAAREFMCAIALVGKPNAGKSSLLNALAGYERSIVSDIAGTTRDSVDTIVEWRKRSGETLRLKIVDTAGIRRKRAIDSKLEVFSVSRAEEAIRRSNVCVLLLDATSGISVTDKKIAATIAEAGRPCIIGLNKWDLMEGKTDRKAFLGWIRSEIPFLDHAPIVLLSAQKKRNIPPLVEGALKLYAASSKKVGTGLLNRAVREAMERRSPAALQGRRLKFFYATQTGTEPPTFVLFVNNPELVQGSYTSYLKKCLRESLEMEGAPLVLEWKARESQYHD